MDRAPHNPTAAAVPGQRKGIGRVYKTKMPPPLAVEATNWSLRRRPRQPRYLEPDNGTSQARPTGRFRPGWRLAIAATASLVAVCLVVLLGVNDLRTHNQLNDARTSLVAANARLSSTHGQLSQTQSQLSTAKGQYTKLESTLSSVQSAVGTQASATGPLKACLAGVSQALQEVLNGQLGPAVQAIQADQASCQQASPTALTAPSGTTTPSTTLPITIPTTPTTTTTTTTPTTTTTHPSGSFR